jgi:hypothetical protein
MGYWFHRKEQVVFVRIGARCLISFLLFVGFMSYFSPANISNISDSDPNIFLIGWNYYLVIGVLEGTGFYQARFWTKIKS